MNQQDTDYHERVRAMLGRVKRENERRFNEQVSDIQCETNSTDAEMIDTLHELGLHDEARRYRAYTYKQHAHRAKAAKLYRIPSTEWGTDHWGEVLSEPDEAHARKVARDTGATLYSRPPAGAWSPVEVDK